MIQGKKILAVIPARSGSKGLPGKNIKMLAGKELIAWTILAASKSHYIDNIFVSTDSEQIAKISEKWGLKVPFLRPKELAYDHSSLGEAINHSLETFKSENKYYDYVMWLQPTSPLRRSRDIDEAILKLEQSSHFADCLVSMYKAPEKTAWILNKDNDGKINFPLIDDCSNIRRQNNPTFYFPNGAVYISKVSTFTGTFYTDKTIGHEMPSEVSVDIDTQEEFELAEKYLTNTTISEEKHIKPQADLAKTFLQP